jgi:uncharacterized protein YjbJ (UPF0337 family)
MSESRSGKIDDLAARIKDAVGTIEDHVDADGVMNRIRETIGKAGSDIDADALVARVKDVAGQTEGKVDAAKLRQWIDEIDRDKLKSWLDEAKRLGVGAASLVEAQGEKLADRAPGAFEKLTGAAKEKLGSLTGEEGLINEEHVERLKGQLKETFSSVTDVVAGESSGPADASKPKVDKGAGRGG